MYVCLCVRVWVLNRGNINNSFHYEIFAFLIYYELLVVFHITQLQLNEFVYFKTFFPTLIIHNNKFIMTFIAYHNRCFLCKLIVFYTFNSFFIYIFIIYSFDQLNTYILQYRHETFQINLMLPTTNIYDFSGL